jgi:hypothetical protein
MGTFVRGEILEAKRPGRIRGRGEFRIALEQMTFSNGYLIDLRATPTSVDRDGREEVTLGGRVTGPGGVGKDVGTVALATVIGGPAGGYAGSLARAPFRNSVAIGHGVGFATGLAVVLFTRGPDAELPRGTAIDSILDRPLILDAASLPADAGAGVDPLSRSNPLPTEARRDRGELQGRGARRPCSSHSHFCSGHSDRRHSNPMLRVPLSGPQRPFYRSSAKCPEKLERHKAQTGACRAALAAED